MVEIIDEDKSKIFLLVDELSENREKLHSMLDDVAGFRKTLDDLLPKHVDYKSKWVIPERIKTVTEVIKSELAIRKQIDESVKTEVDIRRKEGDETQEQLAGDIRHIAKAIEFMEKKKTETIVEQKDDVVSK